MKGSTMKKEASENIVRVKGVPKLTEAQLENLKRLSERPDDEIDYSDIPEITDFLLSLTKARRHKENQEKSLKFLG